MKSELSTFKTITEVTLEDSIYIESQTDIDSYYWETLGNIICQQHLKNLYNVRKPVEV